MLQGIATGLAGRGRFWRVVPLAGVLALLAACGSDPMAHRGVQSGAVRYAPPAPANDPWGPYIQEASTRFGVPEQWIREVMRQESGGHQYQGGQPITSPAGAMGLMQVMPYTYEGLRQRYGLGNDPYDPHDNIMAGTAYIREMYDRYGSPNFLAAYNAGPGRVDDHLSSGTPLPEETVQYVASIAPRLGDANPSVGYEATAMASAGGCDPLAAYDPNGPCATPGSQPSGPSSTSTVIAAAAPPVEAAPAAPVVTPPPPAPEIAAAAPPPEPVAAVAPVTPLAPVVAQPLAPAPEIQQAELAPPPPAVVLRKPAAPARTAQPVLAKPHVAPAEEIQEIQQAELAPPPPAVVLRKPAAPARTAQPVVASAAPSPAYVLRKPAAPGRTTQPVVAAASTPRTQVASAAPLPGRSAVQVGSTFKSAQQARAAADHARQAAPMLAAARVELPTTSPFGGNVYYMVRLTGLSPTAAAAACGRLQQHSLSCAVITSS